MNILLQTGIRGMFLIDREAGTTIETKIVNNPCDYNKYLRDCVKQGKIKDKVRLYAGVNDRDIEKALRRFKEQMLLMDYSPESQRNDFLFKLDKSFQHYLFQPNARKSKFFLIDIDEDSQSLFDEVMAVVDKESDTIETYKTPKGAHIVCEPFNIKHLKDLDVTVHKDGLILLAHDK